MTTIFRQPYLAVTVNGTALTGVVSANVRNGLTSRIATASVVVKSMPVGLAPWDPVVITMGATAATAAVRFTGYYISLQRTLFPVEITLECKSSLAKVEAKQAPEDVDLSDDGAGVTDEYMITRLIHESGASGQATLPPTPLMEIGGTGRKLGKRGKRWAFGWRRGERAIDVIDRLDSVALGYRTYDTSSGEIRRTQVTSIPAASATVTFTEGLDITKATDTLEILEATNQVVVAGYPGTDGDEPISYTATDANPFLLSPVDGRQLYTPTLVASGMIEVQTTAEAGTETGLSCEEVAAWQMPEANRYQEKVELTTPRDDVIEPGDTIVVDAPTRLGVSSRKYWVDEVSVAIDKTGAFVQELTCKTEIPVSESRNGAVMAKVAQATARAFAPLMTVAVTGVTATATGKALAPAVAAGASLAGETASATAQAPAPSVTVE